MPNFRSIDHSNRNYRGGGGEGRICKKPNRVKQGKKHWAHNGSDDTLGHLFEFELPI